MAMHTMGMAVSARPMVSRVPSTAAPGILPVRSRTRTLYSAAAPISRKRTSLLPDGKGEVPGPAHETRRRCGMSLSPATKRMFGTSRSLKSVDFTHAVIGGGAVGLAIARQLAARTGTSTILIERHGMVGSETSSRNSEVIHAGLYYGPSTLKTTLCIRGKQLLYELCNAQSIPHRRTKKWILAQTEQQMAELDYLHEWSKTINVPTRFLSRREIETQEPDVRADAGVLESPTTGIIDSHAYMAYLEGSLDERGGEEILYSEVTNVQPLKNGRGYEITVCSKDTRATNIENEEGEYDSITAETVINSAGLGAIGISNMLLPPARQRTAYFAKGSYFSYSASKPKPSTLLYPAPTPGLGGLGTHLTLDMGGRVRFGPDVEWVDNPHDLTPNPDRLRAAIPVIQSYLPAVNPEALDLDYCGIRPKLSRGASGTYGKDGKGFEDFYIKEEEGFPGFVNLLGIESPGLTASLAIAEYVDGLLYGEGASIPKEEGDV
ncbi:L-2-hydroxyglutarate dehydrogenase [Exophiala dermatitidis]